ncbi:unnamed protein product [Trifolium pratense]|uniref:Uncharacterized protein n=1 Tax=Trifolium pratense TaxID=57577 RepID=A0ACB0J3T5_TRIPR|nr:unnamed protein product [Trifolium pratense]
MHFPFVLYGEHIEETNHHVYISCYVCEGLAVNDKEIVSALKHWFLVNDSVPNIEVSRKLVNDSGIFTTTLLNLDTLLHN